MFNLICMTFDGDYVTEGHGFNTIEEAWKHADDMGSRWYFYPFPFVMTESGKTVKDAPDQLKHLIGYRIEHLVKHFQETSSQPELSNADAETFAFAL